MLTSSPGFSFAANPRPVAPQRSIYRSEDEEPSVSTTGHLMFDPRVRRGNTFSKPVQQPSADSVGSTSPLKTRKVKPQKSIFDIKLDPSSREPVDFDLYLTEQRDKPEEVAVNTQTDAFLPRPPTPPYVPKKTGVDAYTQIEVSDGLFDFDVEVEPILDVIVGKILEQSVVELEQGLELSSLHARKKDLLAKKQAELDGIRAQEVAAAAKDDSKQRKLEAHRERVRKEQQAAAKANAARFGAQFAQQLVTSVLDHCDAVGVFKDPIQLDIEKLFMPNLYSRVQQRLSGLETSQLVVDDLLQSTLALQRARLDDRLRADAEAREAERLRREDEERRKYMRIFVRLSFEALGIETMVGPVVVTRDDTVGVAENKIHQWLVDNPKEETESLSKEGGPRLRLCLSGKPIHSARLLLKCVNSPAGPLELLPISDGAEEFNDDVDAGSGSEDDSGDDAQ